ncbi:MAG: hypothetical protein M0D53_01320 [Flavobacterium sp. JAD_PAG50586_2]|nr:MAG: hypothetical protein M0D53_01320 [Flavobacterium sp. JAD_PAG50586_2]
MSLYEKCYMPVVKRIHDGFVVANNIRYGNSVGVVINRSLLVQSFGEQPIALDAIKKVELRKCKNLTYNIFLLVSVFPLAYLLFNYKLSLLKGIFLVVHIIVILLFAVFLNKTNYRLIIIQHNAENKVFSLSKHKKEDAQILADITNNLIERQKQGNLENMNNQLKNPSQSIVP